MHLARDRTGNLSGRLAFARHLRMENSIQRSRRSIDSQQNTQVADRLG